MSQTKTILATICRGRGIDEGMRRENPGLAANRRPVDRDSYQASRVQNDVAASWGAKDDLNLAV